MGSPNADISRSARLGATTMKRDQIIVLNIGGRGDQDVFRAGTIWRFDLQP